MPPTLLLLTLAQLYKNPSTPTDARVNDLVSHMTLEEKVSQMQNAAPAIPRLGIPAYNWWNEALHGVARAGRATVFPQAIGLAAMFDPDQMFKVATVISNEARAKHHEFLRRGKHDIYQGLTFWSPNINLFRDPRWGRGMETYGEDPYLTGRLAVAFIKGMQGDDPKYFKTIATAKHYAVHSGPEPLRHEFDAVITDQDLFQTYLAQFEMAIKGGADSVMCAYNSVNGQPACANPRLLTDILRNRWGFQGYVVSDCGAIGDIYKAHKFAATAPEGVAAAIKAGTDLTCGTEYSNAVEAVHQGLLTEAEIDRSVKRLFTARFKLGEFDPPEMVKYAQIPYSENDSPAHRALALETARKSIVLLKNGGNALPLLKSLKSIAVIGPNADDWDALVGNYNGIPSDPVTILQGLHHKLPHAKINFARGSDLATNLPTFSTVPANALSTPDHKPGLKGEYFNHSKFENAQPLFTRTDRQIDFHWWDGAPREDMNDDDFGIRWTGFLTAPTTGTYQIGAIGMNAFELYIDNKQITHFNSVHHGVYSYAPVMLEAGKPYPIRLDYHEFVNDAAIRFVWSGPDSPGAEEAIAAAQKSDAVILVLGLSPRLEGEEMAVDVEGFNGGDRVDLGLPRAQQDLLEKIAALNKPTVLVLMNGSALAINWAHDHIPAIVEAWYPGQAGGDAVADVLFGDYNPAGRLPVTFFKSADQLPPFTDYSMKNRTYRFFTGEPLYPFGCGLSYTTFAFDHLQSPKEVRMGETIEISAEVRNTGNRAGDEVVQLYLNRALAGVERISLGAGERKQVHFQTTPREPGTMQVSVGGGQPNFDRSALKINLEVR